MSRLINGKNIMPKTLYMAVVKNHKTVEELALHYDCSEKDIMEIAKRGLEHKAFKQFSSSNENNKVNKTKTNKTLPTFSKSIVEETTEEENEMADKTSTVDEALNQLASQQTDLSILINRRTELSTQIESLNALIGEEKKTLTIRQESVREAQQIVEKAKEALYRAKEGCSDLYQKILQDERNFSALKAQLDDTNLKIEENTVYLVAPNYAGELPQKGKFISTAPLENFKDVSVEIQLASMENTIHPIIEDMIEIGCDSATLYGNDLKFVSLYQQLILDNIDFTLLVSDPYIPKLIAIYFE